MTEPLLAKTRSDDDHTPTSVRVAIVLYENSLDELWRCLRAVRRTVENAIADPANSLGVLCIAIGDCSDRALLGEKDLDDLRDGLDASVSVEYRWFAKNLGHSAACNALAEDAREDALLFLNPDTYVAPNLLTTMVRSLHTSDVVAADARQIPCEHPKHYDPVIGDQSWASGACLLVRTFAYWQVDGFDATTFPSYVNDVDLSWRLRLYGGRVVHEPRAVLFHDKRLDRTAGVRPTRIELYEGLLGRLLLATKYDRADIVRETIDVIREHGSEEQKRAVAEFERRRKRKELPSAVPGGAAVAEFVNGEYGRRRF